MPTSSWWVGSWPDMAAQSISVDSGGAEALSVTAGSYYLSHHTAALSACEALETALETHTAITTATVILSRDRLVRITCDASFTLTWTDTDLRDFLGFSSNLTPAATSFTADAVSDYLWVPDRPENPSARLGRHGDIVYDTVISQSGGASPYIVATQHDSRVYNDFDVRFVPNDYYDTGNDGGGEYRTFFTSTLRRIRNFAIYRDTTHDETDTTDVALASGDHLGPYRMIPSGGPIGFRNMREIANVEKLHRVQLSVVQATEYS